MLNIGRQLVNKLILRPYVQAYLSKHNKIVSLSKPYIDKGISIKS